MSTTSAINTKYHKIFSLQKKRESQLCKSTNPTPSKMSESRKVSNVSQFETKKYQTHPNGPLSTRSPHSNPPASLNSLVNRPKIWVARTFVGAFFGTSRATLTHAVGSSCRALVGAVGVTSPWVDGSMVKKHKGFESTFNPTLNSSATKYTPSLQIQILQEIVPIVNNKEE